MGFDLLTKLARAKSGFFHLRAKLEELGFYQTYCYFISETPPLQKQFDIYTEEYWALFEQLLELGWTDDQVWELVVESSSPEVMERYKLSSLFFQEGDKLYTMRDIMGLHDRVDEIN